VRDYREVNGEALYDKIVSVGMIEHVGRAHLREFFQRAEHLLAPGGACLTQGIGAREGRSSLNLFADRYVCPDAEWPPLDDVVGAAEAVGFEIRDVESLREHYALTVDAWRARLERRHPEAAHLVGEVTYRIWRVAMAAAAYLFRTGRLSLYQTLAVKETDGKVSVPLTRDDWYESFSTSLSRHQDAA
jgi:cyclopropane-fatty-acyl-phospholipid synthase